MMTEGGGPCVSLLLILLVLQDVLPVLGFVPSVPITQAPAEARAKAQPFRVSGSDSAFRRLLHTTLRRQAFAIRLHQSSIAESSGSKMVNETRDTGIAVTSLTSRNDVDNGHDDYPWTDMQMWTLRDQVPRYSIQVETFDSTTRKPTMKVYALWRTLASEVPELAGYPLPFLARRYRDTLHSETDSDRAASPALQTIADVLPFLDEFEFTKSGGMSGRVYGVQGVADGARIETSAVGSVEVTIPKGFVETQDGQLYELGRPVRRPTDDVYSLSSARQAKSTTADYARGLTSDSRSSNPQRGDASWDPELTQFGALTAFVVVGALAFETLQHHLTVNIFWV